MESITIKVEEGFAKEIEKAMKPYYSTKTEFIREAIRDKIKKTKLNEALEEYRKKYAPRRMKQTTYEEERAIREEVGREYAKKFGIKLD